MYRYKCLVCGSYQFSAREDRAGEFCIYCGLGRVTLDGVAGAKDITEKAANDELTAKELDQANYNIKSKDGAISDCNLEIAIGLREIFNKLYNITGITSIESASGIHLTVDAFLATFSSYEVHGRNVNYQGDYPEELSAEFNGVKFFAIR